MSLAKLTILLWILVTSPYLTSGQIKARLDHILRMSKYAHEQVGIPSSQKKVAPAYKDIISLRSSFKKSLNSEHQDIIHAIVEFTGTRTELESTGINIGSQIGNILLLSYQSI